MSREGRRLRRRKEREARKKMKRQRRKPEAVQLAIGELHLRVQNLDDDRYPQKEEMLVKVRELGALYFGAKFAAEPEDGGVPVVGEGLPASNLPSMMVGEDSDES